MSQMFGGGGISYNRLSTLTGQQQAIANQLQGRVSSAGEPTKLDPAATASYIQQSVATPLLRQYDQSIMPRLKDSFAAVGALMGSRRGFAQQQSLQNLQDTIGSELGKAQLQNQQLAAQQALQYNQLGAQMVGQQNMAIQPVRQGPQYNYAPQMGQGQQQQQNPYMPQQQSRATYNAPATPLGPASFGSYVDGLGTMGHADLYGSYLPIDEQQADYYNNQYQGG